MDRLEDQQALDASLDRLVQKDARLAPYLERCQPIPLRRQPAGLFGLLQIILAQQVSVASARAIWSKFNQRFGACGSALLATASDEDLRTCSLSRPKMKTVRQIALALEEGFDLERLGTCDVDEARRLLMSLHGVGGWTADIYLLFCLGKADIFPAGDLALQVAVAKVLELDDRPAEKKLAHMAEMNWAPERGAAAHLFWAIYRDMKAGREGVL
ncbi:DNA-3-methyladenine glycosylase 2 family protein [uncultured Cohaesibacter sp.]|uniref:DNA-3-methyladenine glycosylase family protein n=1 Tax=uncultured Cohaesibacter sp. TaxID=1002546 RepID=UPI00292D0483|nr:DNA-3-methyladenine glycosylase 2 family protein [uncultured Cohaesibacter sp.]